METKQKSFPRKCPLCKKNELEISQRDNMRAGCEYEAEVWCIDCGCVGSVRFHPVIRLGTFKVDTEFTQG